MNVLWDLDGTLVDSMPVITRSMNRTREAFGLEVLPDTELRPFIGPSIHSTFARFLATDDTDRINAAVEHYRACYDELIGESPVFPGIVETLEALSRAGCQQFVATAKYREIAHRLLDVTGLSRWFTEVYGSEADGSLGHKPELLGHLLREEGLRRAETVMIGDTRYDMEAARQHDVTAIGVAWGYGQNEELLAGGAHSLVETPEELVVAIRANLACAC